MNERKQLIRGIILDIFFRNEKVSHSVTQYNNLINGVQEVMVRRKISPSAGYAPLDIHGQLAEKDLMIIQEVFWDLVIDKVITLGSDHANPEFPFFRLHSEAENNLKLIN